MSEPGTTSDGMLQALGRVLVEFGALLLLMVAVRFLEFSIASMDLCWASIGPIPVLLPGDEARIAESLVAILLVLMLVELQFMYRDYWKGMSGTCGVRVPGGKREKWFLGLLGGVSVIVAAAAVYHWVERRPGP